MTGLSKEVSGEVEIFCGNACRDLAERIAAKVGVPLGKSEVSKFEDGEIRLHIGGTVRERDVFIVQSTCTPANDNLMELLIMADALKRASARRVNAVIPYYGYARQDRKSRARDPISAKLVANLLVAAGVKRVISMDLHCDQIQGFFDIPMDHLRGAKTLVEYYKGKFDNCGDLTIVSPDLGSVTRVRRFAEQLGAPLAIVDKRRPEPNQSEVMNVIGDIKGRRILMLDDMIDTAGTITHSAEALMERGAKAVYACCTHPVFSGPAIERIANSPIEELVVLDTIPLGDDKKLDKIKVLSVADVFAEAIRRIHIGEPVSELFQ